MASVLVHKLKRKLFFLLEAITPPLVTRFIFEVPQLFGAFKLRSPYSKLPTAQLGMAKLLNDYEFNSVLDVGSGAGHHAAFMGKAGKDVTALDFGTSIYAQEEARGDKPYKSIKADFYSWEPPEAFDCVWASHVLEHQPNPGLFLRRCIDLVKDDGVLAITVPPSKNLIVGGHLTLWNAGLLLYNLVFNGLDCSEASVLTYGYNITVIVKKKTREDISISWDYGDITSLQHFFPDFVSEPFEGRVRKWNW